MHTVSIGRGRRRRGEGERLGLGEGWGDDGEEEGREAGEEEHGEEPRELLGGEGQGRLGFISRCGTHFIAWVVTAKPSPIFWTISVHW